MFNIYKMSMLAESKRKPKWSLNPRGTIWTNDETKIGQKMLEKMGWSKGKGLGKKENGRIEPHEATYKRDLKGVGYKVIENWIPHQDDFNALLSNLNQRHAGKKPSQDNGRSRPLKEFSLELRSKTSRCKVHYQKFIRGKDISQYCKEDMDCIFGTKSSESSSRSTNLHGEVNLTPNEEDESNADLNNFNGVPTFKCGKNMYDYFFEKMQKKRSHLNKQECSSEKATVNSHKVFENEEEDSSDDSPQEVPIVVVKKKKKKNFKGFETAHVETGRSTLSFEDQLSETLSEDPNSKTLNSEERVNGVGSTLCKSRKSSVLEKRKWDSHSNSSVPEIDCTLRNGSSTDGETVVAVKKKRRRKKKSACLEFSETSELIPGILSEDDNLEISVANSNVLCDAKSVVKKSSLKCNDFTPSRKRKRVSSSNSTSPSNKKVAKNRDYKKCIILGLKSCLRNTITSGLKKVKKMVTFKEEPLFFEEKISEESDNSRISEAKNVSAEDADDLSRKAAESDICTKLPKSKTQESSTSVVEKLQYIASGSNKVDPEIALNAYCNSMTVRKSIWVNNESWAVSQRLAMKLNHYKDILERIKEDKTLSTSNLSDIKGYGNW